MDDAGNPSGNQYMPYPYRPVQATAANRAAPSGGVEEGGISPFHDIDPAIRAKIDR